MTELPVNEAPETKIEEPEGSLDALNDRPPDEVARDYPTCLTAWAALGDAAVDSGDFVDAYAFYRVGYHRGLDRIRQAGWRGSGRVPWSHEGNRGFLRALQGLGRAAGAIGEKEEEQRCAEFYAQLAPDAP
ncbi:MAG: DUF3151 domain-containing protein [Actinomycetota bacterium]